MKRIHNAFKFWSATAALVALSFLSACDDDDPPLPDNAVGFEAETLGFDSDESSLTVKITLSREATADGSIDVNAETTDLTYGTDFTTEPAMTGNKLTLPITQGATAVQFVINKNANAFLDGDESIKFTVTGTDESLVVGTKTVLSVSFAEIVATQATMDPAVGGALQPNKVFVDLSANRQTSFNRSDWDFGFYMTGTTYRVTLNSSTGEMARVLDKTDLSTVTAADTVGFGAQLGADAIFAAITQDPVPAWTSNASAWVDDPSGDITKTAIAEIGASDADNKVYIINRGKNADGTQRGWKKIKITRNGTGYTLTHADIAATTATSVTITRDDAYAFKQVKFEDGVVAIEPKKDRWDIAFTVFTSIAPVGPGLSVPYPYNDFILQNTAGVETAELLTANVGAYEDFTADKLTAGITYSKSQSNIGSKWRSGGGPNTAPALRADRFYLVKDLDGNIYKLKFAALTQGGERGRPQITFALLKKG